MNTATRMRERREEISAEINPRPSAVKYPERNTFQPMKRKTGQNSVNPSQVKVKTCPSATNRWMICFPHTRENARISRELTAMVTKLYRVVSRILSSSFDPML